MADREQVLKALRACSPGDTIWCQMRERGECDFAGAYCMAQLLRDAAELLEAETPMVLMRDEVKHFVYGNPYIIEMVLSDGEYRLMYGLFSHQGLVGNCDFATVNERIRLYDADYGKTWRAWTTRPSDAQREAEPWKEVTP